MMMEVEPSFSPELLNLYYARLFPYEEMCRWLGYDTTPPPAEGEEEKSNPLLVKREFCFTLENDVYCRYRSFGGPSELRAAMLKDQPRKIDIGAIFNLNPEREHGTAGFAPQQRELVFDIDMSDYDDVRTCCQGATVCRRCWKAFIGSSVKVVDRALREDFGFTHVLWIYSGRRGVHCWVADDMAKNLTDQARSAVVGFLSVARSADKGAENLTHPLHPSLQCAYEILEPIFTESIVSDGDGQGHLATPERWTKLLSSLPPIADEAEAVTSNDGGRGASADSCPLTKSAKAIADHWETTDCPPRTKWLGLKKWIADKKNNKKAKVNNAAQKKKQKTSATATTVDDFVTLELWKYDTVFKYSYPRLDENVSKMRNHLLKSPFAVHPKTGRVCVPFDPKLVDDFNPEAVPTIAQLAAEIDNHPDKDKADLDKTSLQQHVAFFRNSFLNPILLSTARAARRERERLNAQNCDF